ncbi:hypothetical protein [Singulisphaera sp. PoT]|uniref:hypothetical protein n=1 Tax=Singulisphaera sp. PoT TaxID=3411797 RepID=UPI003BF58CE9
MIREVLNERAQRPYRLPRVDGLELYALAAVAAFGLRRLIRSSPRAQADEPTSPAVGPT